MTDEITDEKEKHMERREGGKEKNEDHLQQQRHVALEVRTGSQDLDREERRVEMVPGGECWEPLGHPVPATGGNSL